MARRSSKNSCDSAGIAPAEPPTATPLGAEPEAWTVSRLARELGVSVDQLEPLQGSICVAGEDFIDAAGVAVLTASGIKKIRERVHEEQLGAPPPADPAAPSLPPADVDYGTPPPASPHRENLRLTRVFRWSTNVLAETANGLEVVVRVRSIAHLEPGMVLPACIRGEMGWTYEGRLPRTLGERQLYFPPKPSLSDRPAASTHRKK